jgi:hypothetical protein
MSLSAISKTLIISNNIFEKLGCCALSPKAYVSKDEENNKYIKANSLLINNVNDFVQPRFEYWEYKDESINYNLIIDEVSSNKEIRVYLSQSKKNSPISIKSLLGKYLVITIKDGNLWAELVCEKVIIMTGAKIVRAYSPYNIYTHSLESSAVSKFNFIKRSESISIDRSTYRELYYVDFPIEQLYSIEVKGKNDMPPIQLGEDETDATWRVGSIMFSQIQFSVSFDRKIISGYYSSGIQEFGGRRTSNGWENHYCETQAFYYKAFELIHDIQKYIDDLPKRLEGTNAIVQVSGVIDNEACQKRITIGFNDSMSLKSISEKLDLSLQGKEYGYYQ